MTTTHGFELIREQEISELKTKALFFRHTKTGARLLSLVNDDENKVFGITFRTPPQDSTGVAHIMEHSVLCGSRKYPVKEPFVELIKGSLNTFLNAMTYPDKTCYPVASQNLQDFYNLIDVYLDAVFYPRISPHIFQQEGWHYELENLDDPIIYKGVVFNEMKGSYSSPERVLAEFSQQSLFPETTYGVESGGHPRHIPDLTYEQFKNFHTTYYHPSNAYIYFYGDDDPEQRLRLLDAYLDDFEAKKIDSHVGMQPKFAQPRRFAYKYNASADSDLAKKGMVTVNWLLTDTMNPETTLSLAFLDHILVGMPASPLYKALIDSGLGEDVIGAGTEGELRQMYFSTGLKNIAVADVAKVENVIFDTLRRLATEGIARETIAASLNTIEFALRENNTGAYPRGLALMLRAFTTWLYDGDPLATVAFEAPLAAVKQKITIDPRYFEKLIEHHLLENTHRTTVVLEPDPNFGQQEEAAEKARLAAVRARMATDALQEIIRNTQELKKLQEMPDPPEALAKIPMLKLGDLDKKSKTIPIDIDDSQGTKILFHDIFTNGIAYLDLGFNLDSIPHALLSYLPLFSRALLEMGTEFEDFVRLSQRIGSKTGGIWPSRLTSTMENSAAPMAWLFLRSKAMLSQTDDLLAILRDLLLHVRLDNRERFRQMALDEKSGKESGLVPGGHGVVSARLNACFSEAGWLSEQMGGVSYLFFLRQLIERIDSDWPGVLANLEQIRTSLLNRNSMVCNATMDAASWRIVAPKLYRFLEALPATPASSAWRDPVELAPGFEGLTIPAQVNYVGKGSNLYKLGYKFHGSAQVISNYLRTTWLWERVRVQGGAYGGFCSFDRRAGVFNFVSYRDPNLLKTLENYDLASQFLHNVELNADELTKSIIGTIGDIDSYQLPDAKGYTAMVWHLVGDQEEARQQRREEVLATTAADFRAFAEVLDAVKQHGVVVVLGSQNAIETANATLGETSKLKLVKVL